MFFDLAVGCIEFTGCFVMAFFSVVVLLVVVQRQHGAVVVVVPVAGVFALLL